MKILIDTEKKTVRLEEAVCFGELYKLLKQLFPEDFKDWKVEAQPQIQWVYPSYHSVYVGGDTIPCTFTTTNGDNGTVPQEVVADIHSHPENYRLRSVAALGFYTEPYCGHFPN